MVPVERIVEKPVPVPVRSPTPPPVIVQSEPEVSNNKLFWKSNLGGKVIYC